MSRICEVTGKAGLVGNMVSHSNRKKLMKQLPNSARSISSASKLSSRLSVSNSSSRKTIKPPRLSLAVFCVFLGALGALSINQ